MPKLGIKNALIGYFWARIKKKLFHIWNQHYGGPSLPIKKIKNKKDNKNIPKKWKERNLIQKKIHPIIMAYECQIWWKKPFYSKRKKTQSLHGPWVVNLILSYGFYWVAFKTFSSWIVELIEKLEKIKKNVRTWGWETACFRVMVLWRGVTHFCFLLDKYFAKNFYTIL